MNALVANERIKLLATGLNNLALAFLIGGLVGPAVAGNVSMVSHASVTVVWVLAGIFLHGCAQGVLGFLR